MELRQLRYFVKIADLGSLSKASRALHIAQPALSQQMSQLEGELNQKLLTRLSIGVRMTEQGEVFYAHAQRVLRQIDDIPAAVGALEHTPAGTVCIGLPQSTAPQYALPLIARVRERYPAIRLEFFDEISGHILQRIHSGRFDLGVIVHDEDAALLDATPLMDEQLFLVSRADQTPQLSECTAADLAALPLSVPGAGQGIRPMLETFLAAEHVTMPEPAVLANSINIMRRTMLAGLAHTIMPWAAVADELRDGTLVAIPIVPYLSRRVYVCSAREGGLSMAAQTIRAVLIEEVKERVADGRWQGASLL